MKLAFAAVAAGLVLSPFPSSPSLPSAYVSATEPAAVGSLVPGTYGDASGHSAQSHLFYAANSGVWWLLTLTSTADSAGGSNHVVKAFHTSGPDLATATWIASADSPGAAAAASSNCPSCTMSGGRALGVAYLDNAPLDVVHAEVAMAFNGQNGLTAHIRATVTATSIAWETWGYHDEGAATWATPRAVSLGVSSGRFIHSGGPTLQQEVDANARVSTTADLGATWSHGFSTVAVIDNSMANQCNALAFAPLANNAMLAIYDNGVGTEPAMSNLRYKKSNANGSWPGVPVGTQVGGDGAVFATSATIDQNDWAIASRGPGIVTAFRSNAAGTAIDAASYNAATNSWTAATPPPPFAAGQAFKKKAGLFAAASDTAIWLFAVNTDPANSLLYTAWDGSAWTPWTIVPGTDIGLHVRQYISGHRSPAANQIGLVWTEGSGQFDLFTTSLSLEPGDTVAPAVSILEPANQSTVIGTVAVAADASDDVGVASVQFQIDGVDFGPAQTSAPYAMTWDSTTAINGAHAIAAVARDAAGNRTTATVDVTVDNPIPPTTVPDVVGLTQSAAATALSGAHLAAGGVTTSTSATIPIGIVMAQTPAAGTELPSGSAVDLIVSRGVTVPNVVGQTQANATATITSVAGLVMGAVTTASSTTVAAGLVISQNPAAQANVSGGTSVSIVVSSGPPPPPPGPTVDKVVFADGRGTRTTPAFSTSAPGALLIAFVSIDGGNGSSQSASISGANLNWTLVRRANSQRGAAEIWSAAATSQLTNVTVRSQIKNGTFDQSLTVVAFANAAVGASANASAASGAPSISVTTTKPASLVYAVGVDGGGAVARTLGANQVMVHQWIDTAAARTFWVQAIAAPIPNTGTRVTVNDVAPTANRWNLAAIEIRAK